ncbi:MAG: homing endonuclease associated repeat-containing protein [Thermoleophilia bacterium]
MHYARVLRHGDPHYVAPPKDALPEPHVFQVGDPVRALHRLDAPKAGRTGPEPDGARLGVIVELNPYWPVALVQFTLGTAHVPLRRLIFDEARADAHAAKGRQPRQAGTPAAGAGRTVAQPPSPPSEPRPTGTAVDREARAGVPARANRGGRPRTWTEERVLAAIRAWADENGRPPSSSDWYLRAPGRPTHCVVKERFGSWNKAIAAAGFEPVPAGRPRGQAA